MIGEFKIRRIQWCTDSLSFPVHRPTTYVCASFNGDNFGSSSVGSPQGGQQIYALGEATREDRLRIDQMLTSLRECPPDRKAFIKLLADHIHRNGPSALAAFAERAQRELGEGKERWSWSGKYNDGLRFRFEMKPLTEDELERFSTAGRTPPVYNAEFEIITDKRNPKGWEGNAKFSFHYFGRPVNEADRELLNQSRSDKDKVVWVQGGKFKGAK